ncbi:MAG: hypothetical protein ACXW1M_02410 [Acidimicrobiia bacterium]
MKIALIVLGAVASAMAVGLLVAGFVILGLVGSDGFIDSGTHPIRTPTRALVSKTARITIEAERTGRLDRLRSAVFSEFTIRLQAAPQGDEPVFVGVARAADVNAYLAGVDREVVTDLEFDPFRLTTVPRPGDAVPAAPDQEDFWVAKATGDGTVTLDWEVREGNWRFVMMNADGSAGVRVVGLLGAKAAFARPLAFILLGSGAFALILGVVLIVIGVRMTPKPKDPLAFAPPPGDSSPAETAPPAV